MCGKPVCGHQRMIRVDPAVERPHHALDHGDVGAGGAVPVERPISPSGTSTGSRLRPPAGGQRVVSGSMSRDPP